MEQVEQRLGYRFELVSTTSALTAGRGTLLPFSMAVRNRGWAGTINRRPVFLVLRKASAPKAAHSIPLGTTSDWGAGTRRIRTCKFPDPTKLPPGVYRLYLQLPDADPGLRRTRAIRSSSPTWASGATRQGSTTCNAP